MFLYYLVSCSETSTLISYAQNTERKYLDLKIYKGETAACIGYFLLLQYVSGIQYTVRSDV
jgi:hypothetical protein